MKCSKNLENLENLIHCMQVWCGGGEFGGSGDVVIFTPFPLFCS